MEGEGNFEFQDWEVLANTPKSVENPDEIVADSGGIIRLDHFSLDNPNRFSERVADATEEEGSVESDTPSWIDPASETRYPKLNSGELWSDSASDRSDDRKFGEFVAKNESGFEGIGEIVGEGVNGGKTESFDPFGNFEGKRDMLFDDFGSKVDERSEMRGDSDGGDSYSKDENSRVVEIEGRKNCGEEEKRKVVEWWKVPFEMLKYCVLRVGPVWSFSMAAALMGFVILGRRMYKMRRRTHSLQLKVAVDEKKISQVMSRTARLNAAFSVVRRVPIVRPLLPAAGVNPWPVMSLR